MWPGITALAFVISAGAWLLVRGVAEIVAAVKLRHVIEHEWLLLLSGLLSVAFGVLVLGSPLLGAVALATWLGVYAIAFGVLLISLSFKLRAYAHGGGTGAQVAHPRTA